MQILKIITHSLAKQLELSIHCTLFSDRRIPLGRLYNQFRVKKEGTNGAPKDKVNKKINKQKRKGPGMLFGIDKWPSEDVSEEDETSRERDGRTNESRDGTHKCRIVRTL